MILILYVILRRRNTNKDIIIQRLKLNKSNYEIYINQQYYDDIEFNNKTRKVKDADMNNLNINNEADLGQLDGYNRPALNFFSPQPP